MALELIKQIEELFKKSQRPLITFRSSHDGDAVASSLALSLFLRKMDKKQEVVSHNFKTPKNLTFLPTGQIQSTLNNSRKFIISLDTSRTKVGEFSYDVEHDKLNIFITPTEGKFQDQDVITSSSDFGHDLIITLDSSDLESLGDVFQKNTEFFYETAIINIDHKTNNESFGQVNCLDLAATSCAEILYHLFDSLNVELIDEDIATCLLAGIIIKTKNFKTPRVTPKTLSVASELITRGARREEIIQHLYQSRFLSTLKLWGRVLARLRNDLDDKLVWSLLNYKDFIETETQAEDLLDVIEELIINMPTVEIIVLLFEKQNGDICGVIHSTKNLDVRDLIRTFNPQGSKELAKFCLLNITLKEAEKKVIDTIKTKISR